MFQKHVQARMPKTLMAISIAFATASFTTSSFGALNLISDDAALQQQHEERFFSQKGISGEKVSIGEGAGDSDSLALVARILIPSNWEIKSSGDYENAVVAWKGGIAWPHILRNISESEHIYISLDWIQKIATINVPGKTSSQVIAATSSSESLGNDKAEYKKKTADSWKKRESQKVAIAQERNHIELLLAKQKEAQEANHELIAQLNKANEQFSRDNLRLQESLNAEREARQSIEKKYSVINPTLTDKGKIDATELFVEHKNRWVLPFDSSLEYFLNGGHSDQIGFYTPATFIAKQGTIEEVVRHWADELNWHLKYQSPTQHKNPYEVEFKGSFSEAGEDLMKIFEHSKRPLKIDFYENVKIKTKNGEKHGLVVITDRNYK